VRAALHIEQAAGWLNELRVVCPRSQGSLCVCVILRKRSQQERHASQCQMQELASGPPTPGRLTAGAPWVTPTCVQPCAI
jgi:hypothetical protein